MDRPATVMKKTLSNLAFKREKRVMEKRYWTMMKMRRRSYRCMEKPTATLATQAQR